jgi:hypothetical protein
MLAIAFLEQTENDARIDRAAIVELCVGFEVLAVDIEQMLAPERLGCPRDSGVELAMKLVE